MATKHHTYASKYTKTEHQVKWNMLEVEWMSRETRQMPPSAVSSASSSIGCWRYDIWHTIGKQPWKLNWQPITHVYKINIPYHPYDWSTFETGAKRRCALCIIISSNTTRPRRRSNTVTQIHEEWRSAHKKTSMRAQAISWSKGETSLFRVKYGWAFFNTTMYPWPSESSAIYLFLTTMVCV